VRGLMLERNAHIEEIPKSNDTYEGCLEREEEVGAVTSRHEQPFHGRAGGSENARRRRWPCIYRDSRSSRFERQRRDTFCDRPSSVR